MTDDELLATSVESISFPYIFIAYFMPLLLKFNFIRFLLSFKKKQFFKIFRSERVDRKGEVCLYVDDKLDVELITLYLDIIAFEYSIVLIKLHEKTIVLSV